jgi:hypothetical protein
VLSVADPAKALEQAASRLRIRSGPGCNSRRLHLANYSRGGMSLRTLLVFRDLILQLRNDPVDQYVLLGEEEYVSDEESRSLYDLVFHLKDGV